MNEATLKDEFSIQQNSSFFILASIISPHNLASMDFYKILSVLL